MKILTSSIFLLLLTAVIAIAQIQELEAWWLDNGETDTTALGHGIVALGDINSDGLNDFIVGSSASKAYVYFGSTEPDTIPDMVITCPDNDVDLFNPVANIGDVNCDGWDDILIWGAAWAPWEVVRRVYLYFGGESFDDIPDLIIQGYEGYLGQHYFGSKATGVGDFNGDGGNDFVILDYNLHNLGDPGRGHVYLYYGGEVLDSIPDWEISSGDPFPYVGGSADPLGDINDDGYDDLVLGDGRCDPPGINNAGVIVLYYGSAQPDTIPDFVFYGQEDWSHGGQMAVIDFNQDGKKDIVMRNGENFSPNHYTSIHIYLITTGLDTIPDYIIPDQGGQGYSIGMNLMGIDLNGDSWQDIVSGNPGNVLGCGKVYVILGGEDPDTLIDASYFQSTTQGQLGASVCNAGDINGDDMDDLIISESGYPGPWWPGVYGRIHVILGDTTYHQSVGIPAKIQPPIPISQILLEAHPNPFNSQTIISFDLPVAGQVRLEVFDVKGRAITVGATRASPLSGTWLTPGHHQFTFNGENLPSGIYLIRLKAGETQQTKKIVLLK